MHRMFKTVLKTGIATGKGTVHHKGGPQRDASLCSACGRCVVSCPAGALDTAGGCDLGKCIECGSCVDACRQGAIARTGEWRRVSLSRTGLVSPAADAVMPSAGLELSRELRRVFGRSLHVRHVDTGSCNGCDWEMTALLNPVHDIQRYGVDFVASPRHADLLMVTGGVSRHLKEALLSTYSCMARPRLVMALGTCACGGGHMCSGYATCGGVDGVVPVDVYVPGCPPRPDAIIHALLGMLGRLDRP